MDIQPHPTPILEHYVVNLFIGTNLCKNIGIRRAISSGNFEELDVIWQSQIKE